jgi:hypothetical protein
MWPLPPKLRAQSVYFAHLLIQMGNVRLEQRKEYLRGHGEGMLNIIH